MLARFPENPLILPQDVKPSHPDLEVWRAFNAGAALFEGRTVLLVRVAERVRPEPGCVATVFMDPAEPGKYRILRIRETDPDLDLFDPRGVFRYKGESYLYCLSHLRLAVSEDGRKFKVADKPAILPDLPHESFGVEDARITRIDGAYYINYTGVSPMGVVTCLARTRDFNKYEKLGIVFGPENKDMALFPEKIRGKYVCFHRPATKDVGRPSIWCATSGDLLSWGPHRFVMGPRPGMWDAERVGSGAAPVRTKEGWLEIYHGADHDIRYCSAAVLLDLEEPWKVIARSRDPILAPEAPYETAGFLPNVVFHNGLVERDGGRLDIYYGGADTTVCGAALDVAAVIDSLERI